MSNEAAVWTRLETHGNEIHAIKERLAVGDHRHGQHEKQLINICSQLKDTENRVMDAVNRSATEEKGSRAALLGEIKEMKDRYEKLIENYNDKYEKLVTNYNERQGAKKALLIMPTILGVLVTVLTIVNMIKG